MAEKRTKNVTIIEVARLAGVSTATAGRVLGGYGYSSEQIRDKVREAAEKLGYRPNLLARGLTTVTRSCSGNERRCNSSWRSRSMG
jgi:LacI family transcriptional regulator